ncbi:MAG: Hsp20/alpha crystallin family protein [Patescibacteria group bacterium]|nr:Hsp20/alpha crystallin family protein [Patescibacteria group bacterium]
MADLVQRDPFKSLFPIARWFDDFDFTLPSSQRGLKVRETDESIILEAVVAGVPAKYVEITIEDGVVTIKAEKREEKKDKDEYTSSAYQYYYTIALSGGEWDKADAVIQDGIVTVTIPKTKSARPQKITVKEKKS